MIYDSNWISYAMFVVCTVESNCNYGAIEKFAKAGVGIAQWSHSRSWTLLNKLVSGASKGLTANQYDNKKWTASAYESFKLTAKDYDNYTTENYELFPTLYDHVKDGSTQWDYRVFDQIECNEISAALVSSKGIQVQNALWIEDCYILYIPVLRERCGLSDPKAAIFALSVYHQSPQAFWEIYSAAGNGSLEVWYNCTLNNGIVGKYKERQDKVLELLTEWDGVSGKKDFTTAVAEIEEGGNSDPNAGNPYGTVSDAQTEINVNYIKVNGDQLILHQKINDKEVQTLFIFANDRNVLIPIRKIETVTAETVTIPVPSNPKTETSTDTTRDKIVVDMKALKETLLYSQAQSLRTNISGGYCDCSGLVWWLYNKYGYSIGTWTGQQCENGVYVGDKTNDGIPTNVNWQTGDLILFMWKSWNPSYDHVEMITGQNECMGHGGGTKYGPTVKDLNKYASNAYYWQIRRYITV